MGRRMQGWVWNIAIFDQHLALSRKSYKTGHSYRGTPIGTRMRSIEWCYFQWPWVTSNPDFKVAPLFDAEYLKNGTRYRHSFNGILIGTCTLLDSHFKWPWVTLSELAKYSMSRSVARSLCDSWTPCYIIHTHNLQRADIANTTCCTAMHLTYTNVRISALYLLSRMSAKAGDKNGECLCKLLCNPTILLPETVI